MVRSSPTMPRPVPDLRGALAPPQGPPLNQATRAPSAGMENRACKAAGNATPPAAAVNQKQRGSRMNPGNRPSASRLRSTARIQRQRRRSGPWRSAKGARRAPCGCGLSWAGPAGQPARPKRSAKAAGPPSGWSRVSSQHLDQQSVRCLVRIAQAGLYGRLSLPFLRVLTDSLLPCRDLTIASAPPP